MRAGKIFGVGPDAIVFLWVWYRSILSSQGPHTRVEGGTDVSSRLPRLPGKDVCSTSTTTEPNQQHISGVQENKVIVNKRGVGK